MPRLVHAAFMMAVLSASGPASADDPRARELLETDRAFAALSEASDAPTAFARYLADQAILLPRSGAVIEGRSAAVASLGDGDTYRLLWQPAHAEVAQSGELGWTWGRWQLWAEGAEAARGKYVNIWRRDDDGHWKVRLDMGNREPDDPPPAAD